MTRSIPAKDGGEIQYTLTRKQVKNLNLRLGEDGEVRVSAPQRVPAAEIDRFVAEKSPWIQKQRTRLQNRLPARPCRFSDEQCLALFSSISDQIFPLFSDLLGGQRPTLQVREMKSRWGVCYVSKRTITLNKALSEKPKEAIEYVILHEYVHFLHPNHQSGFHKEMARLMPDYKERRRLLLD